MKTARFAAALLATIALALTACGGGSEAEPKDTGDDWSMPDDSGPPESEPSTEPSTQPTEPEEKLPWPCSQLPSDVVAEIYQTEVTADVQEPTTDFMSPQCTYLAGSSMVGFLVQDMSAYPGGASSAEEALSLASGGSQLTPIEGIGELAGYKDGALATLYVALKKGGSYLVVNVTGSPEERDQLIQVAEEVATNL